MDLRDTGQVVDSPLLDRFTSYWESLDREQTLDPFGQGFEVQDSPDLDLFGSFDLDWPIDDLATEGGLAIESQRLTGSFARDLVDESCLCLGDDPAWNSHSLDDCEDGWEPDGSKDEIAGLICPGLHVLPVIGLISLLMGASTAQAMNLMNPELDFQQDSEASSQAVTPQTVAGLPAETTLGDSVPSPPPVKAALEQSEVTSSIPVQGRDEIALNFGLDSPAVAPITIPAQSPSSEELAQPPDPSPNVATPVVSPSSSPTLDHLFQGGPSSLIAKAVGSAEGTRTPGGQKTWAYYGHQDPGNGVWNLGSFSYQHGAKSPADADRKQLKRLVKQAEQLRQQAEQLGVQMSLLEELNGIDLANQSPRAALSRGGYVERLLQARRQGLQGPDAVIWARTRSFLNPDTGRWQAPGLGNTERSITADQERRFRAIEQTIIAHQQGEGITVASVPEPTQTSAPSRDRSNPTDAVTNPGLAQNFPSGRAIASVQVTGRGSIPAWRMDFPPGQVDSLQAKVQKLMQVLVSSESRPISDRLQQILENQGRGEMSEQPVSQPQAEMPSSSGLPVALASPNLPPELSHNSVSQNIAPDLVEAIIFQNLTPVLGG